jgi:integrin beta 1
MSESSWMCFLSRCETREHFYKKSTCKSIEDPPNSVDYSSLVNQSLTSSSVEKFIQISPQYMKLKLRVGQEEEVKFSIAQALEYPVDLYYLMDLSNSMSDDRDNIVKLGGELATAIGKITRDYRIG